MKITGLEWQLIRWALEGLKHDADDFGDGEAVIRACDRIIEKIENEEKENEQ